MSKDRLQQEGHLNQRPPPMTNHLLEPDFEICKETEEDFPPVRLWLAKEYMNNGRHQVDMA